jgi:hypothetical protein
MSRIPSVLSRSALTHNERYAFNAGKGNFTQVGTLLDLLQSKLAGVSGNVTVTNKFNAKNLGAPFDKKKKPPSMAALIEMLDAGRVWVGVHKVRLSGPTPWGSTCPHSQISSSRNLRLAA